MTNNMISLFASHSIDLFVLLFFFTTTQTIAVFQPADFPLDGWTWTDVNRPNPPLSFFFYTKLLPRTLFLLGRRVVWRIGDCLTCSLPPIPALMASASSPSLFSFMSILSLIWSLDLICPSAVLIASLSLSLGGLSDAPPATRRAVRE